MDMGDIRQQIWEENRPRWYDPLLNPLSRAYNSIADWADAMRDRVALGIVNLLDGDENKPTPRGGGR